uniref:Uncharacterized protein n=1 Tax=Rhodnius prolixus TaxID=13249 RepID=T1IES4_RHOPR
MVFQTVALFVRSKGPDEFWRKRRIFKLAAHFIGRRRNCYSIAIRYVHRALAYATKGRKLKKEDMKNALTQIAWTKVKEDGVKEVDNLDDLPPRNVLTRGLLK